MAAFAVAMLAILGSAVVMLGNDSSASYAEDYGQVYEIDLAPGFRYAYTPTYPSDLNVTTSIEKYESAGITASVTSGTLSVTVNEGITSGSYDLILKAETSTGGLVQTAYQHIRFNIVSGLSVSGSINDIIAGASVDFTPSASSGMTSNISWSVKSGTELPDGLTLSNGKVTGTPTTVGVNTVSLTANAGGETKDLVITFTVYNVIVGGSAETIFSNGIAVSSTAITQTGSDLGVTWAVTTGTLPAGFTLNPTTGVVSGSSTTLQETTVTLTGTAANGPAQTATKTVTIKSEPKVSVTSDGSDIIVYPGSASQTLQMNATAGTSAVTWSVSSATGVSISPTGLLTVTDAASSGTVTVTATTAYGATATKVITIIKEPTAAITGNDSLTAMAGAPATAGYTCNVAGSWTIASDAPAGVTVTIDDNGVLSLSGSSPVSAFDVTIVLTTEGGQEVTKIVTCQIVSQLIFSNNPSSGAAVYVIA